MIGEGYGWICARADSDEMREQSNLGAIDIFRGASYKSESCVVYVRTDVDGFGELLSVLYEEVVQWDVEVTRIHMGFHQLDRDRKPDSVIYY